MRRGSGPTGRLLTHGYEATREAAVPAFRTRWRREQQMAKQKADRFQPSFRAVIRRSRNGCSRAFPWSRARVAPPPSLVPRGWIAATLQHQALHAGSELDQPAVDREVLAQAEACEPAKKGDRATFGGLWVKSEDCCWTTSHEPHPLMHPPMGITSRTTPSSRIFMH